MRTQESERGAFNIKDALVLLAIAGAGYLGVKSFIPFYHSMEVKAALGSTWRDYMRFGKDNAAVAVQKKLDEMKQSDGIPLDSKKLQVTQTPDGGWMLEIEFDETVDYGGGYSYTFHFSPSTEIER